MGGFPLDRTPNQKKVDAIAEMFNSRKTFRLALSPEGTRRKTDRWKTGFYFIARKAHVPIISIAFDYSLKTVIISEPFYTRNFPEQDLEEILKFYSGVRGKAMGNYYKIWSNLQILPSCDRHFEHRHLPPDVPKVFLHRRLLPEITF